MIELRLLGPVELVGSDGQALEGVLAQPKRLALLAYLAAAWPTRFHRRDSLLALFWPELNAERGRDALNQALHHLRRSLGNEVLVKRGPEEIGVNSRELWCDATVFRRAERSTDLTELFALYRGDLLEGFFIRRASAFEEWLERTRADLRARAGSLAALISEECERAGDLAAAAAHARRAVEFDAANEKAVRRLMTLLHKLGDRVGALAAYEVCSRTLARDFDMEPSPETRALAARMRLPPALFAEQSIATPRKAEVLDAYLRGMYYLARRTGDDTQKARVALERAVGLDPQFARGYARLAEAYVSLGHFGFPGGPAVPDAFRAADEALASAFALDPTLAEPYLTLAKLRWTYRPDLAASEAAIRKALALNPTLADAHYEYGRILTIRGAHREAIAAIEHARELDPFSAERHADVAWAYSFAGRHEDAVRVAKGTIDLDAKAPTSYQALGVAYGQLGRVHEAVKAFEDGLAISSGNRLYLSCLGHAYARASRHDDARRILTQLIELCDRKMTSPYFVAQVHVGLGDHEAALWWLGKAATEQRGGLAFLYANPSWLPLRPEPQFQGLLETIGLPLVSH